MRIQFVMSVDGVDIRVEASSSISYYAGLPHMECVGSFSFDEVEGGSRGSAARYYQDCDEIILLAATSDEVDLAKQALSWLEENDFGAWECMNWNTAQVGRARDFQRHSQSDQQEDQQEQSQMIDQSQQQSRLKNQFAQNQQEKEYNQLNEGLANMEIKMAKNSKQE